MCDEFRHNYLWNGYGILFVREVTADVLGTIKGYNLYNVVLCSLSKFQHTHKKYKQSALLKWYNAHDFKCYKIQSCGKQNILPVYFTFQLLYCDDVDLLWFLLLQIISKKGAV